MAQLRYEGSVPPQQGGQVNTRVSKIRIWDAIEGRYIENRISSRSLLWVIAIGLLLIAMIGVNFYGMYNVRRLSSLNRELTELQIEHMTISTDLMVSRRLSTIEGKLAEEGVELEISRTAPILIK